MSPEIIFAVAGWLPGESLDEEISELFTIGSNESKSLKDLKVYSIYNHIIIEMETALPLLDISLFTIDGKMISQHSDNNLISNRIELDTGSLPIGTTVFVKLETRDRKFIVRKISVK